MPILQDITGERYGRLTALRINGRSRTNTLWLCRCDCGNEATVIVTNLRNGHTKSCGCLQRERARQIGKANQRHGESQTREYRCWASMRSRCRNSNNHQFKNYGGRGIAADCERWNSYENFLADMGRCPPGKSLDRINNDGDYEPSNCHWATASEQASNRRMLNSKRRDKRKRRARRR